MVNLSQTKERTFLEFKGGFFNNITHIGKLNFIDAHPSMPPHTHRDTLEICYVYRGNPVFQVNEKEYHLRGGDVFISFPNEEHSTGSYPQDRMILYWLGVKLKKRDQTFLQLSEHFESEALIKALDAIQTRSFRGNVVLKNLMDDVFSLYFSEHEFKKILMRNRITDFLTTVIDLEKTENDYVLSRSIRRCTDYISENLNSKIPLEFLADLSGLSLSRFKQRFKEETGVPPGDYILRRKMEQAALLLRETDRSITDIAFDLGVSSTQYFATLFKKYQSCSPSLYRKRLTEPYPRHEG